MKGPPEARGRPASDRDIIVLESALNEIAPDQIVVGARRINSDDRATLHAVERLAVVAAVRSRQDEFASGRALLRRLMGSTEPIPVSSTRAPILPTGVRGSLAHDHSFAVSAITRDPTILGLGIDIEPSVSLPLAMAVAILRPDERSLDAHLAFILKEAAYKAWSNVGGPMVTHHQMRLHVEARTFVAEVVDESTTISGTFGFVLDRCIAMAVIRSS